ncbi:hypothetical protein JVU11DRAFT_5444 [Chiua virens]|nr:hypothetical protein JVU11DRAFT_5444 [Chiua virens]
MPRYYTLVLAFVLATSLHAIPLDEVAARDGVGTASPGVGSRAEGDSVAVEAAASCPSTACALVDASVLKVASEDAGRGGNASSETVNGHSLLRLIGGSNPTNSTGEARGGSVANSLLALTGGSNSTNSTGGAPQSKGSPGASGEAKKGSVTDNLPTLVELDSDNAEQGGDTPSRNSSVLVNQAGDVGQKGRKILTS